MVYWTQEQIERVYSAAQEERLAVFMGSGVSASSGLPDWDGLIQGLLGILDNPSVYNKRLKSGIRSVCLSNPLQVLDYLYKMDEQAFVERFRKMFPANKDKYSPTEEGLLISKLDSKKFIAINYDFCFQHSFAKAWPSRKIDEYNGAIEIEMFDGLTTPTLCQLHGCATNNIGELVLMDTQYDRAYAVGSLLVRFLEHLLANYLVLFVGFGFQDKDLLRVMARSFIHTRDSWKYKHIGVFGRSRKKNDAEAFRDFARRMWNTEVVFYDMHVVSQKRSHHEIIPLLSQLIDGLGVQTAAGTELASYEINTESMATPPSIPK